MVVSRLLEFYWQALLPSVNRLEKTLPRLYQTGEGSSKHSDSVIGSGSGIDARVAFWLVMFAIATYIKGHWHCTGGASLREPVAVPLDKVPQPPGEFHAQALHVVRAVDVRRGFLQTSTISFLRLLPAPPRERLLQPVTHPRDGCFMEHELLELAGLNGSIGGEESLELMASQSCAIAVRDGACARVVEAIAAVREQHLGRGTSWKPNIHRRLHLRKHDVGPLLCLAGEIGWKQLDVQLPAGEHWEPPHAHSVRTVQLENVLPRPEILGMRLRPFAHPAFAPLARQRHLRSLPLRPRENGVAKVAPDNVPAIPRRGVAQG